MKDATAAWLVKDDKAIIESIDLTVFAIATRLERDPIAVVRRLSEERPATLLEKAGYAFEFEHGSEEEAELLGLTLSGVPLSKALLWCSASDKRPSAQELAGFMKEGDRRPALHQARELGMWVGGAEDIDDLVYLEQTFPAEITEAAIADLLSQFQPPRPGVIVQYAEGEIGQEEIRIDMGLGASSTRGKKRSTASGRRRSYGRSGKRSYAKRKYSSSGRSRSAMYAYFG